MKVDLSESLVRACEDYGRLVVQSYRTGMYSSAVSSRGAEGNVLLQGFSRMAECAVCLWAGLDPLQALKWTMFADPGFDVLAYGARIDVKATGPRGQYLLWPVRKRHLYANKPFDALVLVRGERWKSFELVGWIPKGRFAAMRQEAPAGHVLDPGTWFLHASALWPMESLTWGW